MRKEKNKEKYFELIFFLCILIISLALNLAVQEYAFPNTDTNQNDLFSNLLIENQSLEYNSELNERYDVPIFGIRGLLNFGGNFVPSIVPGSIVIVTLFKFTSSEVLFLINPIFVFICLWYFYRIINKFIFKNKFWSLFTVLVYFFSGAFLYVSSTPFKDLAATATFFVGLYYFLNGIYEKKTVNFLLFGFFAGVTMWMSYPNVIFYLPVIILYLFTIKKEVFKKENLRNLKTSFASFLILFIPLYIYQASLFRGFLNFNNPIFRLNHYDVFDVYRSSFGFILDIDFSKLLANAYNQFFLVNPILISFSILGLLYLIFWYKKNKEINKYLIVLLAIIAMQFLFYLGKDWSGVFFEGSVGTSYSRYLLISWGLLIVLATYAIRKLINKKLILIFFSIFLIFSGLSSGLYSDMAVNYFIDTSEWSNTLKTDIVENTPENAIFFTSFYDKHIYPVRQTAIYVALPEEERANTTINLMKKLLNDEYPVYIVNEKDEWAISPVTNKSLFENNNLRTQNVFRNIYEITSK